MNPRAPIAFLVGAILFAVVPYFDTQIPGQGERGELLLMTELGVVVGATVALIAGHWRAWWLALLAVFAGALASGIYYEIALEPPPRDGFEFVSVAYGAFYTFAFSFPFVLASALVVSATLALASASRRAQLPRTSENYPSTHSGE
jgi:hypothetical protein